MKNAKKNAQVGVEAGKEILLDGLAVWGYLASCLIPVVPESVAMASSQRIFKDHPERYAGFASGMAGLGELGGAYLMHENGDGFVWQMGAVLLTTDACYRILATASRAAPYAESAGVTGLRAVGQGVKAALSKYVKEKVTSAERVVAEKSEYGDPTKS